MCIQPKQRPGESVLFFFLSIYFLGVIPYCEPSSLNTHVTVASKRLSRRGGGRTLLYILTPADSNNWVHQPHVDLVRQLSFFNAYQITLHKVWVEITDAAPLVIKKWTAYQQLSRWQPVWEGIIYDNATHHTPAAATSGSCGYMPSMMWDDLLLWLLRLG